MPEATSSCLRALGVKHDVVCVPARPDCFYRCVEYGLEVGVSELRRAVERVLQHEPNCLAGSALAAACTRRAGPVPVPMSPRASSATRSSCGRHPRWRRSGRVRWRLCSCATTKFALPHRPVVESEDVTRSASCGGPPPRPDPTPWALPAPSKPAWRSALASTCARPGCCSTSSARARRRAPPSLPAPASWAGSWLPRSCSLLASCCRGDACRPSAVVFFECAQVGDGAHADAGRWQTRSRQQAGRRTPAACCQAEGVLAGSVHVMPCASSASTPRTSPRSRTPRALESPPRATRRKAPTGSEVASP